MNTHDVILSLDRMVIEEAGPSPTRIAQAVVTQLELTYGAMPIEQIAYALDIKEIRYEPLTNLEGALFTLPNRAHGSILINSNVSSERQKFTLAHELGHYLNVTHRPSSKTCFTCDRDDLKLNSKLISTQITHHQRQEIEANRFAIEILAPASVLAQY